MGQAAITSRLTRSDLMAVAVITGGLLGITYLHYSTAPGFVGLHAVYRYFYFLPIVYAALRFGYWGGLIAALVASILFAPHIVFKWGNFPEDSINDLLVVVVFLCVAIITGLSVDRLRAAQMAHRQAANELATSLHKLEEQGEELRRAERLSALGSLAGGLAHQIRNPVGIIRASAQLLESDESSDARETALVIEEETDRIEHLVQDLLHYADGTRPQLLPEDLCELIDRVATRVRPMAEAQAVEVQTCCEPGLPLVAIDSRQMEQALLNLTINAIQALGLGGVVVMAARESDEGQRVDLSVSDNGPGIEETELQQVFDPFFSTKDSGSGLGLSVVHRIVEDHGTSINVTSKPGIGTTFVIRLATISW
jgi:two-component system sensor histidine kinase HydH